MRETLGFLLPAAVLLASLGFLLPAVREKNCVILSLYIYKDWKEGDFDALHSTQSDG